MTFWIPASIFVAACAGYALLDLWLQRGLRRLRSRESASAEKPPPESVTVLVAARNEESNLPGLLDALLGQEYPQDRLQIVIVDDRSQDGTSAVLADYARRFPGRLETTHVTQTAAGISPKKNALLLGLELARGTWIATTDADCRMGPHWLSGLSREFSPSVGMVLGLTCYEEPATGFDWGRGTQALEFISYGVVSAALVGLGFPVHANANNLAYRRQAFDAAAAFGKHGRVVSGDDDFVLQEIHATGRWRIRFCTAPEARVRTAPPESWQHFWEQRKRWASKCGLYRPRQAAFLAAIFLFYAAVPILLLAGLHDARFAWVAVAGFSVKTLADYAVMRQGLRDFELRRLLRFFPLTALLHVPVILAAVVAGSRGSFTWKGQRLPRRLPLPAVSALPRKPPA